MRVLYLIPRFPVPSETFISQEVVGIRRLGQEIVVAAFCRPKIVDFEKLRGDTRALVDTTSYMSQASLARVLPTAARHGVGQVGRLNRRLARESTIRTNRVMRLFRAAAVARLAERSQCQHVHVHWPAAAQVAALVHAMTGIPYSMSVHAHEATHDDGHFQALFETLSFASFCNRAVMRRVMERYPLAQNKCHLVYHGVDLDRFAQAPLPPVTNLLRIVTAGRLSKVKAFDRVMRAVRVATDRHVPVHLTIIGDGPEHSSLSNLAKDLRIADRVVITGWIPHAEVREHLARAHVFTLLSDDYGLPNVCLEAQAVGRPAILAPMAAASEGVTEGLNGYIVGNASAYEQVAEVWRRLLESPTLLRSLSEGARGFVEEEHDRDVHLRRLLGLLTQRL